MSETESDQQVLESATNQNPAAQADPAEADYLNSDEEEELSSFSNEFINLLKAETIKSRKQKPKDSISNESIQVYSLTVGILSEQLLARLPGVINFTLRNFSTSNKISYRKAGNYRIILGTLEQLKKAERKLLELTEQSKVNVKVEKEARAPVTDGQEPRRRGRKRRSNFGESQLPSAEPVVDSADKTPGGRRISSRLLSKPRKSYASLHIFGQTDEAGGVKAEPESDFSPDTDPDYVPNRQAQISEDGSKTTSQTVMESASDNSQWSEKPLQPKQRGPGRPSKRNEKSEPGNCDICFFKFPSRRLLEYHRSKHFGDGGQLTDTALALHVQGLAKHNMEENLSSDLAEQVNKYRESLKSGSKSIHVMDGTQDSFIISEIQVEGVNNGTEADAEENIPSGGDQTAAIGQADLSQSDGKTVKKKRGRKSNFEKRMPFMIRGKVVAPHLGLEADQKHVTGCPPSECQAFECSICHNKMTSAQSLKVHVKNVHLRKRSGPSAGRRRRIQQEELRCPHCNFVCYRTQNFSRHLKTHQNPDLYMCDVCDYTHKLRAEVLRHKRNAHAARSFRCDECGSMHRSRSLLNMHVKLKHELAYSMVCETCGKRCSTKAAYREHVARHAAGEPDGPPGQIMCTLCARVLPSRNSFEQHRAKFHGDDFEAEESRQMNEGVVILPDGAFQCKYCSAYRNGVAREVRRHILRKHMPRKYQCDHCRAAFPLEKLLVKHVRIVHYGLEKKKCSECNKWFRNNVYLTQHMKRVHAAEFRCDICKKLLSDKRTLQDHYEIHKPPDERSYRFTCQLCDKRFRFQSNYDYHMMEHTGSKPYACTVCSRQFRTKHVLERHLTTHSDNRPYACDKCRKTFKLKKYLDAHQVTHSGNRYVCNLCWKPYGSREALAKHTCKSHIVQSEDGATAATAASIVVDGTTEAPPVDVTANDDRIVQKQILVESGPGDELIQYYMCAACQEGFIDADEAIGHVCQTEEKQDAVTEEDLSRQHDAMQAEIPAGADQSRGESRPDGLKAQNADFQSVADGQPPSSLASILGTDTLLDTAGLDDGSLLPSQQFVLLQQDRTAIQPEPPSGSPTPVEPQQDSELPVEMYMCGLCNVLFNSQEDIQDHLQVHADQLADGGQTQMLLNADSSGIDLEKQEVPITMETELVAMDESGRAMTMVLEDNVEQNILLKEAESELV